MNQKVIITRGLSGSGKTTWSQQFVKDNPTFARVSRDDIDFMLSENFYDKKKEALVFELRDYIVAHALASNFNVVLDETYLVPKRIEDLNGLLTIYVGVSKRHLDIQIQDFIDVPVEQCIERDKGRFFHVGEKFIRDYHKKYIKPLLKNPGKTKWTI